MALSKSSAGWYGFWICTFHVAIYTAAVCLFWWSINPFVFALIFVPHWIIDRWSLANWWLKLIRGRTFEAVIASTDKHREFDVAFTSIVYTVVDNTMHLISLWLVIQFILL